MVEHERLFGRMEQSDGEKLDGTVEWSSWMK